MDLVIGFILGYIGCVMLSIVAYLIGKKKNKQTTFVYCPNCDNELISSDSFVKDEDFVYYKCSECDIESIWDFDAPAPILIRYDK